MVHATLHPASPGEGNAKVGKGKSPGDKTGTVRNKLRQDFAELLKTVLGREGKQVPQGKEADIVPEESAGDRQKKTLRFSARIRGRAEVFGKSLSAEGAGGRRTPAEGQKPKEQSGKGEGDSLSVLSALEPKKVSENSEKLFPGPAKGQAEQTGEIRSPANRGLSRIAAFLNGPSVLSHPGEKLTAPVSHETAPGALLRKTGGDGKIGDGPDKYDKRTARKIKETKERAEEKPEFRPERTELKDLQPVSPEDQKKDGGRETVEIRVTSRGGAERFSDELRGTDVRESRDTATNLLNRLREDGNDRIVRSARIILRDREEGEIRLILKPERLGEVRIRLHLQDNLIGGRIFVENSSIREAFEQNLQELASAFRESGFELAGLDVSVGNGGEDRPRDGERPRFMARRRTMELEQSVPSAQGGAYYASHAVNLVV